MPGDGLPADIRLNGRLSEEERSLDLDTYSIQRQKEDEECRNLVG